MKAFIEDRNGIRYEFKNLTRKQKILISKKLKNANEDFEKIDEIFADIMKLSYPDILPERVEDILDYNEEVYGLEQTYELVSMIIQEVFTQVGGEVKTHPYLQVKHQKEQGEMNQMY